jgi:effector-binding domain-containing protein
MDVSPDPQVVELVPQESAIVRETVPMDELPSFFSRAYQLTRASAASQGRQVVGPPFGIYFGMPSDTVDVAAGFPVDGPIEADGDVSPHQLPGGRAVELLHVGPYDSLQESYGRLSAWMGAQNLTPGEIMWESYLNEPQPDDPDSTRTMITWTIA